MEHEQSTIQARFIVEVLMHKADVPRGKQTQEYKQTE